MSSSRSTRLRETIQGILGRVLRIEPRAIDPRTPFVELGADSLALVEALRGLQEAYGVKLTIRQLFEQLPTVEALAAYLDQSLPETETPPVSEEPVTCPITPPAPRPGSNFERIFNLQIQAFQDLVAQQLQMLGARGAAPAPVAAAAPPPPPSKPVLPAYLGKAAAVGGELSETQKRHLDELIARYTRKTARSKEIAQRYRPYLADSRGTVGFRPQTKEMLYPIARDRGQGARIWDVDGNEYVDVTMGMGVHLFGHDQSWLREAIERQVRRGFELGPRAANSGEVARLFCELTGMERATFTNSGTEACMTAIRLARAKTGKSRIAMFAGSYHGHSDGTLAQSQEIEGRLRSFPVAPGIPAKVAEEVLVLDYGSDRALEILDEHRHDLAAVFVEPIQSRRPDLVPREFLHRLRAWTKEHGVALLFDEMICGFRLHLGGAQAWFGVKADLATYGKIIGGGLPIGVVAGSAEYMDGIDGGMWRYGDDSRPERETTFFGGTFCQHPLAMAAARTVLERLKEEGPGLQERLNATTARFAARLNGFFEADDVPIRCVSAHSLFRFTSQAQIDLLYYHLVDNGVYVWEWRNCFLSTAHTEEDLDHVVRAVEESVAAMRDGGFLPGAKRPDRLAFWGSHDGKPAISPVVKPAPEPAVVADRDLRFGLYFFGHYQAEFQADKYDLLFEAARFADAHGFASIWFPERHFHPFGGLSPNPSVLASALARETSRLALRAGSVVLPLHHPARVAEEWSLVDNLAGGRVGVAYASGWHPNDFALAPESYGDHRELMFERIEIVRRLWQGEAVRVKDGAGSEVDLRIFPLPSRRDLPAWITIVHNPDTWRRAGTLGAGVLTNLMGQTVETLAAHVRTYREALRAAGHPPEAGHVTVLLHTFLGPDAEAAIETARRPFYRYLESSVGLLKTMIQSEGLAVDFERLSRDDLDYMLGLAYRRYVETSALLGSPDSVMPIVERLRGIGVDEIACLVDFGVEREAVLASLPWLARLKDRFPRRRKAPAAEPLDLPLTEAQEDLLTVVQLGQAASVAYNEPGTLGLVGPLDLAHLRRALQEVVDRHQALRAVLPLPSPFGDQVQRVLPEVTLDVPLVDVSALPAGRREDAAAAWSDACGREPFDLVHGPLVRASVLRLGPRLHRLFLAVHHLMADGLSVVVIVEEILAVYEAERAGRHAALPAPMQLSDYVAWSRRAQDFSADEAYWLDLFADGIPVFEPPTDRPRPPVRSFRGAGRTATLAPALREAVRRLAREQGATFFIALLAAYTALLHRFTGQDDLVVGVPTARRPLEGGDRLVAHAVDLVPIRSGLDSGAGATFAEHLLAVRGRVFAAHDHGEYPFPRLVRALKAPRDLSRAPLANVLFNLDQDLSIARAGGLQILGRSPGVHGVKLDLVVHALERGEALRLDLEHSTDLFDAATMLRLLCSFESLLVAAVEDPDRPVAELPLAGAAERFQLLVELNQTARPYPREAAVHRLFAAAAAASPAALAVTWAGESLSYAELDRRANRLAQRLRGLGVGRESPVILAMERSPELVVAMLAVLKVGGFYVPLDLSDPADRQTKIAADVGAAVRLDRAAISAVWLTGTEDELASSGSALNLAYAIYTSGSTGRPKGVAVPHRAVVRLVVETDYVRLGPDDRVAHLSNTAFDAATFEVWGALLSGARLVILPRETVLEPAALGRAFQDHGITAAFLTTSLFNEVVRANPWALAGIRHLLVGGEAVTPRFLREALAHSRPDQRLLNAYGPTESTTFAVTHHVAEVRDGVAVPIGRPVANTRAYVVDRHLRPVPLGAPGELLLGGDGLARGYLHRPDLTAERFIPDPFDEEGGGRLYRTGDLVRRRGDGAIEFLGRTDTQVKVRGFRVEPGEVEAALLACPGVVECAVVARERDDATRQLVAWVVRTGGETADLRAQLRRRLPEPMVPAVFVSVESLPKTASGKLDRRALARTELPEEAEAPASHQAPRTPLEELVASVWADVLGRPRIGLTDHFFDLGGHSLLASRVLTRLRGALGVEVPLSDFFKDPTVQGLVRRLEQARRSRQGVAAPPLVRVSRESPIPLSFAQERLWLLDRLQPGGSAYNSYLPLSLTGDLSVAPLAAVLREIQRRHEVLRTSFASTPSGPVQVIRSVEDLADWFLPLVDLSRLGKNAESELRRLSAEEARRPFDLERGPLLRAALVRLSPREHALLLNMHHAVCDGWSLDVMAREMGALYRAFLAGKASPLPELPIQYADFAAWQRGWLQGEALAGQLDFWRRQLGDQPAELDLPFDRPRSAVALGRAGARAVFLPADLAARLAALARSEGGTLFTVLLAGYATLLSRLTGQERVSVGTPVANRSLAQTEGLVGFFVNTLVLAVDLTGEPSGRALVSKSRETVFAALDHQDLPFEKVVAALVRDRDPGRQPLFQAMLVLQNNQLPTIELPGLQLAGLPTPETGAQLDLVLSAVETQGGVVLGLGYAAELFDPATPARWLDGLARLLEALVSDPERPVASLALLSPAELHQATVEPGQWPVDRRGAPVPLGVWGELGGEKVRVRADGSLERSTHPRPLEDRLADRKRQLAARRGHLSPEKRALLAKWVSGEAPREQPAMSPSSLSPLVAVQPEGSRTPLFFVHSGHGAAHPYLELGGRLKPEQPLYAFESPGLSGGPLPTSLEDMAAQYLGVLRSVQESGPYRLGGWCTGGVAAFEMARQLLAAGEEVEILLLLDSHAPPERPGPLSDEVELLMALARQLATTAGKSIQLTEGEVRRIPAAERLPWLLDLAGEHGILPPSFALEQAERAYAVLSANVRATELYRPRPLAVPAVLFRAAVQPPEAEALPALGWERWIKEPVEVIPAEGDHGALLREPGVADLAAAIQVRIEVWV